MSSAFPRRKIVEQAISEMKQRRLDLYDQAYQISLYIAPYAGVFEDKPSKRAEDFGKRQLDWIINDTAVIAKRELTAALASRSASESTPWFTLEPPDISVLAFGSARQYIHLAQKAMRAALSLSNFYPAVSNALGECVSFGTAVMTRFEKDDGTPFYYTHSFGSYFIRQNEIGEIDTIAFKKKKTVADVVNMFGLENVGRTMQEKYRTKPDTRVGLVNFIERNHKYNPNAVFGTNSKKYSSVWYSPDDSEVEFYRESGYSRRPFYCLRWNTAGEFEWGVDCPAMLALGDTIALQDIDRSKARRIELSNDPILTGSPEVVAQLGRNGGLLPAGSAVANPDLAGRGSLTPAYQVNSQVADLRQEARDVEARIQRAFFLDKFFNISNMQGVQPRNQLELARRTEEALYVLGPLLQSFYGQEFALGILADLFEYVTDPQNGILPPPPPELAGQGLSLRFISSLAQAQKTFEVAALDEHAAFVAQLAASGFSGALDKFDADAAVEERAKLTGVTPIVVVPQEVVLANRQAQAEAAAAQAGLQAAQQAADIVATIPQGEEAAVV